MLFRIDIKNPATGELVFSKTADDLFSDWPIDSYVKGQFVGVKGEQIEVCIRRIF